MTIIVLCAKVHTFPTVNRTNEVNLLVTLHDTEPEEISVPILRQSLRRHMQSFSSVLVSFSVQQIRRFGKFLLLSYSDVST